MIFTLYIAILAVSLFISVFEKPKATQKVTEMKEDLKQTRKDVSQKIFDAGEREQRFPHLSHR